MNWTTKIQYDADHAHNQVTLTREDGRVIRSTWWPADGSAQCEADEMRRDFERIEREAAEQEEEDDPLPPWDASKCSCHISPPCGYCESVEYAEP